MSKVCTEEIRTMLLTVVCNVLSSRGRSSVCKDWDDRFVVWVKRRELTLERAASCLERCATNRSKQCIRHLVASMRTWELCDKLRPKTLEM